MKAFMAIFSLLACAALAYAGASFEGSRFLLGSVLPYAAMLIFIAGFAYRVLVWARSPVPFRITVSCGQQSSLPWIKSQRIENPRGLPGVCARMALETLAFRSLLRNTRTALLRGGRLSFGSSLWLWMAALAFHWSMLVLALRHLALFTEPVPAWIARLRAIDGMFEIGLPALYITTALFIAGTVFLLLRRFLLPQLRYVSLISDYFILFLLLGIGASGVLMRHVVKIDVEAVKRLAMGLATFKPISPPELGGLFYAHLFLVCLLITIFPFTKLMHMAGALLSPTRNLANNSRMKRHVNPWDYPVKTRHFKDWQEEFKDRLTAAGYELEEDTHG